jgi:raffinose/stachyose/melibiose transport system permease protein
VSKAGSQAHRYWLGGLAIVLTAVVFVIPFLFILIQSFKDRQQASLLDFSWPTENRFFSNVVEVVQARDYMLITAFVNSTILTVSSVAIVVVLGAMVAFVLQRRVSKWNRLVDLLILSGLIIPPAVVPTIWVLQNLGLFRTLPGLILIEIAFHLSFTVLLFRAFISTIPRELDEAAILDGAGPIRLFFQVIFPLLKSVSVTVIVVTSVAVFNDFVNPLYFLPGDENATVQLTLFNFQSQFNTQYNLLFTDILLVTIPPLVMFLFFNRKIVEGMTAGAVKG